MKNAKNIFYSVQSGKHEYLDTTFPEKTMIRDDDHPSSKGNLSSAKEKVTWLDSIDIRYPENHYSLFGEEHDITGHATDIYQGQIGNCWFMHGASAVARKPGRLEKIFYNTELSNNGIYALRLYILGVPTTVTIDDQMPMVAGNSIFAAASPDGALWGMLIEKAFAKLHGNYESIVSGDPRHSIEVLTGAPA